MSAMTDDTGLTPSRLTPSGVASSRMASGLVFSIVSATSFGLSGSLARSLIESGWTAAAAVTARIVIAALVLVVPAVLSLRGRWALLRGNATFLLTYAVVAIAGCQLAYFSAVARMDVGIAILIEFTAPVAVLVWLWLRHGQRPSRLTIGGAVAAILGMLLVLDIVSGADVDPIGVTWALVAMLCGAFYWIVSADEDNGLPAIVLAAGGLTVGGIVLLAAGAVGILDLRTSTADVDLAGADVAWWVPVLVLGVVTAGLAFVLGIAATRRLGSRLASFVGMAEVVASVVFAWLLLDQSPAAVQLAGGALILLGVVAVRLGEPATQHVGPEEPPAP